MKRLTSIEYKHTREFVKIYFVVSNIIFKS